MSSASEIIIQSDASKKGWEVLSESAKRRSVDSPEFKPPYHCSRIVSHQISPINVFKNCQSQISSFPSQRYQCIPDENGGGDTKQGDNSHFKRDLGFAIFKEIMLTSEYLPRRLDVRQMGLPEISKTHTNGYYLQEYPYSKKSV